MSEYHDMQWLLACQEWAIAAHEHALPHVRMRPRLFIDGDHYCALYGENLQDGCAGFGKSPALAMSDFDENWKREYSAPTMTHTQESQ